MGVPIQLDDVKRIYEESIQEFESKLDTSFTSTVRDALLFGVAKWESNRHICMNLYILEALNRLPFLKRREVEEIGRLTLPMEAIIQSLDDTVDLEVRPKDVRLDDDIIKFFQMSYLFLKLYDVQKKQYKNSIYATLFNSKPNVLKLLDRIVLQVIGMTELPLVEKRVSEEILECRHMKKEVSLATDCLISRAEAIEVYFHFIRQVMPLIDANAFEDLITLLKLKRALELIRKDIEDIQLDLENKSYTPISALFQKHGFSPKFNDQIILVSSKIRDSKTKELNYKKPPESFTSAIYFMEGQIGKELDDLNDLLTKLCKN